jgi:hypothetical protein
MNTTKQYYNLGNKTESNAFFIETRPNLTNPTDLPDPSPWGVPMTFSINFTDEDQDLDTVKLWIRKLPSGSWTKKNENTTVQGNNVIVQFTPTFSSDDIGDWEYFFNASDSRNYETNTSVNNFTIRTNYITFEHDQGDNTSANRSAGDSQTLKVRVKDTDRNTYLLGSETLVGKFLVTNDTANNFVTVATDVATDSNGYLTTYFTPTCTPTLFAIGPQRWKASMEGDPKFSYTNSSDFRINITTYDLKVSIIQPNGEVFLKGIDSVIVRGNVTDDCGGVKSSSIAFVAKQGSSENLCGSVNDEQNGYYNCTFTTGTGWSGTYGYYNVSMNSTKQYYTNSVTDNRENAFYLATKPELLSPGYSSSGDGGWGESWTFTINVKDIDSGNVNVSLWVNLTGQWQLLNSTICPNCASLTSKSFTGHKFACGNIGPRYFKFNASDQFNYTNETTTQSFSIDKDTTTSEYKFGHLANVDRRGETKTLLVVRILDTDNNTYVSSGFQGRTFVTTNYADYDLGTSNTTNSTGYLNVYFNPS